MWQDRNFLRVIMSRALVESEFSQVLSKVGLSRHVPAFVERLKHFDLYRSLPEKERAGLAQSIKVLGLVFGFMRPVLLGLDRSAARNTATDIAAIMIRGISRDRISVRRNRPLRHGALSPAGRESSRTTVAEYEN